MQRYCISTIVPPLHPPSYIVFTFIITREKSKWTYFECLLLLRCVRHKPYTDILTSGVPSGKVRDYCPFKIHQDGRIWLPQIRAWLYIIKQNTSLRDSGATMIFLEWRFRQTQPLSSLLISQYATGFRTARCSIDWTKAYHIVRNLI